MLSENGCKYTLDKRPTGGLPLIASKEGCYNLLPEELALREREEHQKVLKKFSYTLYFAFFEKRVRIANYKSKKRNSREIDTYERPRKTF